LRIFLCHSSGDKPAVRRLYSHLLSEGFEPWFDEEDLLPGQDWESLIRREVRRSDIVVVCLSRSSVNRRGFVQKEIGYVLDAAEEQPPGAAYVIPLKLEECEIPDRLARWQWVRYFEERGHDRLLKALRRREGELGAAEAGGDAARPVAGGTEPPRGAAFRRVHYESFDLRHQSQTEIRERLGEMWLIGKRGVWEGEIAEGVYHLTNLEGTRAALQNRFRYFQSENNPAEMGDCKVSVRVRVGPPNDSHSGAGLTFRADGRRRNYYAFLLNAGDNVSFAALRSGKLDVLWSQEIKGVLGNDFNALQIVGRGSEVDLHVNGIRVHSMAGLTRRSGDPGTMAFGIGKYAFDDFAIYQRMD
jgi:hypothetical protein